MPGDALQRAHLAHDVAAGTEEARAEGRGTWPEFSLDPAHIRGHWAEAVVFGAYLLYGFGHYVVTHERGVRDVAEACLEGRGYTLVERNGGR